MVLHILTEYSDYTVTLHLMVRTHLGLGIPPRPETTQDEYPYHIMGWWMIVSTYIVYHHHILVYSTPVYHQDA